MLKVCRLAPQNARLTCWVTRAGMPFSGNLQENHQR